MWGILVYLFLFLGCVVKGFRSFRGVLVDRYGDDGESPGVPLYESGFRIWFNGMLDS